MHEKPFFSVIVLLAVIAVVFFAIKPRTPDPVLTITSTYFLAFSRKTYTITTDDMEVSHQNSRMTRRHLARTAVSPELLATTCDPALATLESLYEDSSINDGFALEFQFNTPGHARKVTVMNCYVPRLFKILDECNKLLPSPAKFSHKEQFIAINQAIRARIEELRARKELSEQERSSAISGLERILVNIED